MDSIKKNEELEETEVKNERGKREAGETETLTRLKRTLNDLKRLDLIDSKEFEICLKIQSEAVKRFTKKLLVC